MRRLGTLLASIALVSMGSWFAPSSAHAQEVSCPPHFLDLTTDSVLDEAVVTKSSEVLGSIANSDVYVLALESVPGDKSLGSYLDQLYVSCSDLSGLNGEPRGNVMMFAFSMDGYVAIDLGANFNDEVAPSEVDRIQSDVFGEGLAGGDFTGAVVNAQDAVADNFRPSRAGAVLKWVLSFAIGVIFLFGFILWVIGRRQRRLDAQAEAKEVAEQASSKIGALTMESLVTTFELLKSQLSPDSMGGLQKQYDDVAKAYAQAVQADSAWNDRSIELDPERRLSLADYQTAIEMNTTTVTLTTQAADAIGAFEARCNKLLKQIETAPEALNKLKDRLEKLMKDDDKLGDHDAKMVLQAKFSTVQNGVNVAKGLIDEGKTGEAVMVLEKADVLLDEISTSHDEIREEIDRRKAREEASKRGDVFGRSDYQPPSGDYNRPSQPAPAPQRQRRQQPRRQRQNQGGGFGLPMPGWPGGGSKPHRKSGGGGGGFGLPRRTSSPKPKPSATRSRGTFGGKATRSRGTWGKKK